MKFQIKDLRKLLHSIQQNNIDEINIKGHNFRLTINKSQKLPIHSTHNATIQNKENRENTNIKIPIKQNRLRSNDISNSEINNYSTIVSPMVGTFYRAPGPDELPFVELYDTVQKQQTVCIIEAMKLMNEIEAEVSGEIVEILVKDGDIIDCGQALMRVKPTGE